MCVLNVYVRVYKHNFLYYVTLLIIICLISLDVEAENDDILQM